MGTEGGVRSLCHSNFYKDLFAMKRFLNLLLILCGLAVSSAPVLAASAVIKGEVLEVKDVDNYTYLRLKTNNGEVWSAIATAPVKKGATVTIEDAAQMDNFESKSLKKTFAKIFFGRLATAPGAGAAGGTAQVSAAHAGIAKTDFTGDVKVPKASGAQAHTVAEIISKSTELKDKSVLLRARVVKFNAAIMGKNWIHLRDGSGSAAAATDDLLATSGDSVKVGDTVLISGTVRKDKDFGSGYAYKVIIEDAKVQK
jgi:hypothetical protein